MPSNDVEHTGRRIARIRKLRGYTQRGLADRAHVHYGTIFKIEQGTRQASPAVLAAIAHALSVPVAELSGLPYMAELQQEHLDGLIQPIRESLDVYDLGVDDTITPRSLADLADQADRMCELVRATNLRTAAAELPALIHELTTAAHAQPSDRAWAALASLYRTAFDITTKLGFHDLASIALDRMAWAAERASDPTTAGLRQYLRSLAYLRAGQYRTGKRLADVGQKTLSLAAPSRTRDAVAGQLHLGAAVLAARSRDGGTAIGHIEEARRYADLTGEATRVFWLSFGPTNVAAHHVSVLLDQDQYAQALTVAKGIRVPDDWPASRAAHHHAEIARAQLWTGRADAAFKSLLEAKRLAPQQTKFSPTVRETAAGLQSAKRATPDTLAHFVHWLGLR
ncbi:transcriptional regulator with XRE-family HTH domain [Streptacidiphilus sp. MAP12-33]|uniref:helix-turn-helix domain-containing protein n=1 Tax=Streptacidiphilus sp. MAP12-33 TaxID=3156266 RepID=UPI0035121C2B